MTEVLPFSGNNRSISPDMQLADVAVPQATLMFVLYAVPAGMVVLLPSLWFLFRVL